MKKITLFLAVAATAAGLASCGPKQPKANLKSDVDTLSYSLGISQTKGLKSYLAGRLNIDTTNIDGFIKGVLDGASKTSKKDIAYMTGLQIGQQISNQMVKGINKEIYGTDSTKSVNKDNILAGFVAGATGKNVIIPAEVAQGLVQQKIREIKEKALYSQFGENKEAGEKFLKENKSKEGVVTTESGLQYKVIKKGKGKVPTKTSKVKVNYKGTLIDGTEFDSSYARKEPATFYANQVIKGWTEALTMMPVGSKWELYIPQELAYGSRQQAKIKPFSTLVFEVELLGIEK